MKYSLVLGMVALALAGQAHGDPAHSVSIAAGCFLMGATSDGYCAERPAHPVCLDSFEIDATEVTNAAYGRCIRSGACRPTAWPVSGEVPRPEEPVTLVSWEDARGYCAFVGSRLPTEAEWELAGRGQEGHLYPWGDAEPACEDANFGAWPHWGFRCTGQFWCKNAKMCRRQNPGQPETVGSRRRDRSPSGVLDLSGNAAEWVADYFDATYYQDSPVYNPTGPSNGTARTVRGGGWNSTNWSTRLTSRQSFPPDSRLPGVGFRCARGLRRDAPPRSPTLLASGVGCTKPSMTLASLASGR